MAVKILKNGHEILSEEDWFHSAPPKRGTLHWKPGRSAMELARAWVERSGVPAVPSELATLLAGLVGEGAIRTCIAHPEHQVAIDDHGGERPNIDLAIVFGDDDRKALAVCIEAKADESFGDEVFVKLTQAALQLARDERTKIVARIQGLAHRLLPRWKPGLAHLGELRYQVLTGDAATLKFAELKHANIAVFVVHEFVGNNNTKQKNLDRNADDLNRFVRRLTGIQGQEMSPGTLIGPIRVPRNRRDLYIGKIRPK